MKEGDLLIELDPTITQAEVESSEKSLAINRSDMARLKAELRGDQIRGSGKNHEKFLPLQADLRPRGR